MQAIAEVNAPVAPTPKVIPLAPFPLTTMVLNVTNQCNLSCEYCYEYGEDKIVDTENGRQPKFMSEQTARDSVDFMLRESGDNKVAHVTFFGGETLLNFPVLQKTIAYARQRGAELGKQVDFSLTTNGTLLKPDVIEFLAENQVGVTISIDGPKEVQDKFRVFHNGTGSYDVVAPKIKELLKRHRSRPIGARVTLTSGKMDVKRIFRHLTEEIGFWEVGFAPVTTAPGRGHAISDRGYDEMLAQFRDLADEFLEASVAEPSSRVLERQGDARGTAQGRQQGVPVRRRSRAARRRHGRRRRAVPSLRRVRRAQARDGRRRHRSRCAAGVPRVAPHREQDRLQPVLGAAALLGRLLSRSAHALRRDDSPEPALLRLDPRLDRRVFEGVRRARRPQSRIPRPIRRRIDEGAGVMNHLKAVNRKAARVERATEPDVVALQRTGPPLLQPHFPIGCSLVFSPGWEADRTGGTAGLCQPVERDLFDCHIGCYWPAQVPDQLNHAPDWTSKCAAAQKDWRKIDLDFPVGVHHAKRCSCHNIATPRRLSRALPSCSRGPLLSRRGRRSQALSRSRASAPATAR